MIQYNTRIAPSPTGDMHIGTARTAYFNWLAARATGGKFYLRIDDTDASRNRPESIEVIFKTMEWLGLDYDGVEYQSRRFGRYRDAAQRLMTGTPHGRLARESAGAIVLDLGQDGNWPRCWRDEIAGAIAVTEDDLKRIDGMVLIKSDGSPTYNFCSIIDDLAMGINYVIRGVDHITNTTKQLIIHNVLTAHGESSVSGQKWPKFAHVGLIGMKGKPLSKREGASSMLHYQQANYDPDAMLNFLARLGWGPKVDDKNTRTLPRERMLELFLDGGNLRNSMANMDLDKLEAYDRKYKAQKKIWRNKDRLL